MTRALVVFSPTSGTDDFLTRRLKAGFKHVFVAIESGPYWIQIDGKAGVPEIAVAADAGFDLASFYRDEGYTVVETHRRDRPVPYLVLGNCVGIAKSVIGLRSWTLSPYQLYRRLTL